MKNFLTFLIVIVFQSIQAFSQSLESRLIEAQNRPPKGAEKLVYCDILSAQLINFSPVQCGKLAGVVLSNLNTKFAAKGIKPVKIDALVYQLVTDSEVERISLSVDELKKELGVELTDIASVARYLRDSDNRKKIDAYAKKALGKTEGEIALVGIGSKEVELFGGDLARSTKLEYPLRDFDCYYQEGPQGTTVGDYRFILAPAIVCVKDGKEQPPKIAFCVVPKGKPEPYARDCVNPGKGDSSELLLTPKPSRPETCRVAQTLFDIVNCFDVASLSQANAPASTGVQ